MQGDKQEADSPNAVTLSYLIGPESWITRDGGILVHFLVEFDNEVHSEYYLVDYENIPERVGFQLTHETFDISELTLEELDQLFDNANRPRDWQIRAAEYFRDSRRKSPKECAVVVLYDEGYSASEIGQMYGLSTPHAEELLDEYVNAASCQSRV